jgi:hypothetical protein
VCTSSWKELLVLARAVVAQRWCVVRLALVSIDDARSLFCVCLERFVALPVGVGRCKQLDVLVHGLVLGHAWLVAAGWDGVVGRSDVVLVECARKRQK